MATFSRGSKRPQPQRDSNSSGGTDVHAMRGTTARNKDKLKSDHDRTMSAKPAARKDEFGSDHNVDKRVEAQVRKGREQGRANLEFRESGQDVRVGKRKNKSRR